MAAAAGKTSPVVIHHGRAEQGHRTRASAAAQSDGGSSAARRRDKTPTITATKPETAPTKPMSTARARTSIFGSPLQRAFFGSDAWRKTAKGQPKAIRSHKAHTSAKGLLSNVPSSNLGRKLRRA